MWLPVQKSCWCHRHRQGKKFIGTADGLLGDWSIGIICLCGQVMEVGGGRPSSKKDKKLKAQGESGKTKASGAKEPTSGALYTAIVDTSVLTGELLSEMILS